MLWTPSAVRRQYI